MTEREAYFILNGIPQVGPITFESLLSYCNGDVVNIFSLSRSELMTVPGVGKVAADAVLNWQEYFDIDYQKKACRDLGARFIARSDASFPSALNQIYDAPIGLYSLGPAPMREKAVAIVGSRRATLYGLSVAKRLAADLAKLGFSVVSGMAKGIDTAAHEGALQEGGETIAVLGNGVDVVYPAENEKLYQRIRSEGAVVSEFMMGRRADRRTFPMRNRIVSGLVKAVVVVETNSNGGSMITARMAMEQSRTVCAVPGRIDQPSSKGCHELIRDGAVLCASVDHILEELNYLGQMTLSFGESDPQPQPNLNLSENEALILNYLNEKGLGKIDDIVNHAKLSVSEVSSSLLMMELKKLLVKRADGSFEAHLSLQAR